MSSFYDDASLVVIPSGYKTSKVYAEKPTDGSGDLAFTRTGDTATRVNSAGLIEKVRTNLALYSEDFTNASWTKSVTVTANAGTAPNGTTTADLIYPSANSSNSVIFNGVTIANSTEYTNSIYVKASGKTWTYIRGINDGVGVWFDVANGVLGTTQSGVSGTITSVGSGWYRCSVTQTSSSTTGRLVVLVVDGNGSTAVTASGTNGLLIWGAQIETGVATAYIPTTTAAVSVGPVANVPRLDYTGSTCPRLLLEPQRTNLVLFSEQFNNAVWDNNGGGVLVTANNTIAPDGTQSADKIENNPGSANSPWMLQFFSSLSGGQNYVYSIYAKAATAGTKRLGIWNNSTSWSYQNISVTTEWKRFEFPFVANASATQWSVGMEFNTGETEYFVWGAQLEAGAYATSYIPTLAASATRGDELLTKTSISSLIGQVEGTLLLEFDFVVGEQANYGIIYDAGFTSYIYVNQQTIGNIVGQIQPYGIAFSTAKTNGKYRCAIAYKSGDSAFFVNGVQIGSTNTTTFTLNTMDRFTFLNSDNTKAIHQALLFKTRLSNAALAELTTL